MSIESIEKIKLKTKFPFAIVIGLNSFTGLQTARILAKRNVPVIGITPNPKHPCCKTRVCYKILTAETGSYELIELLAELGKKLEHKAVLFPCSDMSVLQVSQNQSSLKKFYHIALPDFKIVELLMNKIRFYTFAQENGFPIPGTYFLKTKKNVKEAVTKLNFPCLLKPPVKTPAWEKNTKLKVFKIYSPDELFRVYDQASNWAELLMVQEWIEGADDNLYSCNCYFNSDSKPLATFIARKIRQWPPEIGTSSLGEECKNDFVLQESIKLFKKVGFYGLGYVEIKKDSRTGKHYIIEPNIGRPTGRSAIAEAGGVELLYTMYCDCLGLPLPLNRTQKYSGVKWIYLRHDLQSAWNYWRNGKLSISKWWQSIRGRKAFAVFSWSDPLPFIEDFRVTFMSHVLGFKKNKVQKSPQKNDQKQSDIKNFTTQVHSNQEKTKNEYVFK